MTNEIAVATNSMKGDEFERLYRRELDAYIKMRVEGFPSTIAMRRSFGEAYNDAEVYARVHVLEGGNYYIVKFRESILATPIHVLWNEKIAVHELVSLVKSPVVKDATRLGAIKELNILTDITIIDENGKTKKGKSLDDFYTSTPSAAAQKPE